MGADRQNRRGAQPAVPLQAPIPIRRGGANVDRQTRTGIKCSTWVTHGHFVALPVPVAHQ